MSKIDSIVSDLQHLPRGATGSVLQPDEAKAWQDGHQFLAALQQRAKAAEQAISQITAEEKARGYEDGKTAGVAEASRLVAESHIKIDTYLQSIEPQVANLAVDIVQRMLGHFDVSQLVAAAAAHAVAALRRETALNLTVHPDSVAAVRDALAKLNPGGRTELIVDADATLDRDSCILRSPITVIDAGISTQMAAIAAAIGATRHRDVTP